MRRTLTLPDLIQQFTGIANLELETLSEAIPLPNFSALDVGMAAIGIAKIGWRETGNALVDFTDLSLAGTVWAGAVLETGTTSLQDWALCFNFATLMLAGCLRLVQRCVGIEEPTEHLEELTGHFQGVAHEVCLRVTGNIHSGTTRSELTINFTESQLVIDLDNLHPVKVKMINTLLTLEQTKRRALSWLTDRLDHSDHFVTGIQQIQHILSH